MVKSPIKSFILLPLSFTIISPLKVALWSKPKLNRSALLIIVLKSKSIKSLLKSTKPLKTRLRLLSFETKLPSKTWSLTCPNIWIFSKTLDSYEKLFIFPITEEFKYLVVKPLPVISNSKSDLPNPSIFIKFDKLKSNPLIDPS